MILKNGENTMSKFNRIAYDLPDDVKERYPYITDVTQDEVAARKKLHGYSYTDYHDKWRKKVADTLDDFIEEYTEQYGDGILRDLYGFDTEDRSILADMFEFRNMLTGKEGQGAATLKPEDFWNIVRVLQIDVLDIYDSLLNILREFGAVHDKLYEYKVSKVKELMHKLNGIREVLDFLTGSDENNYQYTANQAIDENVAEDGKDNFNNDLMEAFKKPSTRNDASWMYGLKSVNNLDETIDSLEGKYKLPNKSLRDAALINSLIRTANQLDEMNLIEEADVLTKIAQSIVK